MITRSLSLPLMFTSICTLTTLSLSACDAEEQGSSDQTEAGVEAGISPAGTDAGSATSGAEPLGGVTGGGLEGGAQAGGEEGGGRAGEVAGETPSSGCDPSSFQSRDLLPSLRSTQIHPDATWDGEAFWVTWTIPNDESKFEVWAGRFGCDLEPLVEPFPLDQQPGMNDTDSVIAVDGEQVLVAWMRDNGYADGATYNLSTLTQRLDRQSGERRGEVSALPLVIDGEPKEGNLWMPDVSPSPEGGYVLVAAWGNPEASSFQVVMMPLSAEGEAGEAWLMDPEGRDQTSPVLSQYGAVFDVMWAGKSGEGAEGYWVKTWRLQGDEWMGEPLIDLSGREWLSAAVGRGVNQRYEEASAPPLSAQEGAPYLIGSRENGVIELITPDGARGAAGVSMSTNLGPTFGYGLIASYQRISGTQNRVWWRGVSPEGSLQPIQFFQQDGPAAPYPLSITPFPGGHLALWAQGYSPDFMLKATLFRAAP